MYTKIFKKVTLTKHFPLYLLPHNNLVRCGYHICAHIHHTFSLGESQCTLEDILIFISGACRIPPGGFGKQCSLEFLHSASALLPTSSTCEVVLRLPTCHSNYSTFKEMMMLGVKGHDGFGRV